MSLDLENQTSTKTGSELPVILARFGAFDERNESSGEASKGARFGGRVVAVIPGAEQEHKEREDHDEAGDAEAEAPADVVLDVAGHHGGDGGAGAHAEVP